MNAITHWKTDAKSSSQIPSIRSSPLKSNNLSFQIKGSASSPSFFDGYCATRLCHPDSFSSFRNPYPQRVGDDFDCATALCHQSDNSRSGVKSPKPNLNRVQRGVETGLISGTTDAPPSLDAAQSLPNGRQRPSNEAGTRLTDGLHGHEPIIFPHRRTSIRKGSGLIVRGQMFYVKWKVPREFLAR
jgi:hypothetical protein